jgi:ribonuclease BN (tRNA processing enzyme)
MKFDAFEKKRNTQKCNIQFYKIIYMCFCKAEIIDHILLQHIHHDHELHVLGLAGLFRLQ